MEQSAKKHRVWQFALKWPFVILLVVAAFFAGRESSIRRARIAEQKQAELETKLANLMDFRLYPDRFAVDLRARVDALAQHEIPMNVSDRCELLKGMGVDLARLPYFPTPSVNAQDADYQFLLSPNYKVVLLSGERRIWIMGDDDRYLLRRVLEGTAGYHVE